jgi:hypothetical protein
MSGGYISFYNGSTVFSDTQLSDREKSRLGMVPAGAELNPEGRSY